MRKIAHVYTPIQGTVVIQCYQGIFKNHAGKVGYSGRLHFSEKGDTFSQFPERRFGRVNRLLQLGNFDRIPLLSEKSGEKTIGNGSVKILIYGLNYWPELTGVGKFTSEMAEWMAWNGHAIQNSSYRGGHDVRVVTAVPYYPSWRVSDGYSGWHYSFEEHHGVKVWRCPMYIPQRPSGVNRLVHLASFGFLSWPLVMWQCLTWKPDILINLAPTLFSGPFAIAAARWGNIPAWLHIQDFEVDAAFSLGLLRFGWAKSFALLLERVIFKCFSRVSTIAPRMRDKLLEKGVPVRKVRLFPNWVDAGSIFPLDRPSTFRKELGIAENQVVAMYSGTLGVKQGLEILVEAARAIPDVLFVLSGQGGMMGLLQRQMQGFPNVYFLPLQPLEKLNDLLNLADIHLLPQKRDAADLVMPSKLTGMFASGRPVVATANPGTQLHTLISPRGGVPATDGQYTQSSMDGPQTHAPSMAFWGHTPHRGDRTLLEGIPGLCTPPEDAPRFIEAIRWLADHAQERREMGAAARRYAKINLDREAVLSSFLSEIEMLCSQ